MGCAHQLVSQHHILVHASGTDGIGACLWSREAQLHAALLTLVDGIAHIAAYAIELRNLLCTHELSSIAVHLIGIRLLLVEHHSGLILLLSVAQCKIHQHTAALH